MILLSWFQALCFPLRFQLQYKEVDMHDYKTTEGAKEPMKEELTTSKSLRIGVML